MKYEYQGTVVEASDPHPACVCQELMLDTPEFADLLSGMVGFDANKPVVRQKSTKRVVVGRRREIAALLKGLKPVYADLDVNDLEAIDYAERDENNRRHLTPVQRAAAAVRYNEERVKVGGTDAKKTTEQMAEESGVSRGTVVRLQKQVSPLLLPLVQADRLSVNLAKQLTEQLPQDQLMKVVEAADPEKEARKFLPKPPKAGGSEPVKQANAEKDGKKTDEQLPKVRQREGDESEPQLDKRFMPNAAEAEELAGRFLQWKQRFEIIRSEIKKVIPDRNHVLADRIDLSGQFLVDLTNLIDTLDKNIPSHPCPNCCGTGEDESDEECRYCDGYGVIDRSHYDGLKPKWKQTLKRYNSLAKQSQEVNTNGDDD